MPEALRDYAADQLRYIRETMERAGSFTSIPGWGGCAVGVTAAVATVIAQPMTAGKLQPWLLVWLAEAVVASSIGWAALLLKAKRSGTSLTTRVSRQFFIGYFAPMIGGAI